MVERDPHSFINKLGIDQTEDLSVKFGKDVLPFIYHAFCLWCGYVNSNTNSLPAEELEELTAINQWVRVRLGLVYGEDVDQPDFLTRFPTEIKGVKVPPLKLIPNLIQAWQGLMLSEKTWEAGIENMPYFVDLTRLKPLVVSFMPKIIILGDCELVRIMDSFYVPNKRGADWSRALFDYLGPQKYEQVADLELKRKIDQVLLPRSGFVFDIGCGSGLLQEWKEELGLSQLCFFGIDVSSEMIKAAEARGEPAILGDVAKMTPEEIQNQIKEKGSQIDYFDQAVMSYVDNWLSDDEREKVFKTVFQLLREGGSLRFNIYDTDIKKGRKYYKNLLTKAGFREVVFFKRKIPARDGVRVVHFCFAKK